eukprot:scaffold18505_cov101-Cylindrotheca_fusiformis.AAC.1
MPSYIIGVRNPITIVPSSSMHCTNHNALHAASIFSTPQRNLRQKRNLRHGMGSLMALLMNPPRKFKSNHDRDVPTMPPPFFLPRPCWPAATKIAFQIL